MMIRLEELLQRQTELVEQIRTGRSLYLDDANCSKAEQELLIVNQQIKGLKNEA
jgi:hypothetical protein